MQEKLAGTSGPVSSQLRLFIDSQLGNPELSSERVAAHYAEICVELRRIGALSTEFAMFRTCANASPRPGNTNWPPASSRSP